MKLLRLSIDRFAGLKNKTFVFSDGMNVLYGDNETGKSTIVRALEASLFLPAEIKGTSRAAKEQKERLQSFLPLDGGDYCALCLEMNHKRQTYLLKKQWGSASAVMLSSGDDKYTGDESVSEQLRAMLPFSEATVRSLVFAGQKNFKHTINDIRTTGTKDISDFLSRAVLDMGGVSIPTLKKHVLEEYERLTGNWDMEHNLPKNGKGIDNPYQRGNGAIIEYYYARERARRELRVLEEREDAAARSAAQIKQLSEEIAALEQKEASFSAASGNLILRREKEQAIAKLLREQERIADVKKKWIELESSSKTLSRQIDALRVSCDTLDKRAAAWEQADQAEAARATLSRLSQLRGEKSLLEKQYLAMPTITREELEEWKSYEKDILLFETEQSSAKLTAQVKTNGAVPVYAEDAQGKHTVQGTVTAQGRLTLTIGNVAVVNITAGENADNDRKISYEVSRRMCRRLAEKWSAPDSAHAQELFSEKERLAEQLKQLEKRCADLLVDTSESKLRAAAEAPRPEGERQQDVQQLEKQLRTLAQTEMRLSQIQEALGAYEQEFSVFSAVLLREQEIKEQLVPLQAELKRLTAECPSAFENAEEFIRHMKQSREMLAQKRALLARVKETQESYFADTTAKEAAQIAEENNELMNRAVARAVSLEKIMRAVNHTLRSIQSSAYHGLTQHFRTYLAQMTQNRYTASDLNNSLEFALSRKDKTMPPALLSEGTADALALAFRFAMLDDVMGGNGFCVLDDCLVDLDPERRACAAQLIRSYADKHQVIFATCSEETARLLGGNLIHMQERI